MIDGWKDGRWMMHGVMDTWMDRWMDGGRERGREGGRMHGWKMVNEQRMGVWMDGKMVNG